MDAIILLEACEEAGIDFYTGVPDSQLKALCDYLMATYGIDPKHHVIAANEGNCAALAAGYHLATGRVPVVYLQNRLFQIIAPQTDKSAIDFVVIVLVRVIGQPAEFQNFVRKIKDPRNILQIIFFLITHNTPAFFWQKKKVFWQKSTLTEYFICCII